MNPTATENKSGIAALAGKYLTVVLDGEYYGIPILKVREIIRPQKITPMSEVPECVKGVIDLRGRVVVIVDLRVKFGLTAGMTERACIVVVQLQNAGANNQSVGLIVDGVEEVVNLSAAQIEPTPDFGGGAASDYFLGMAKVNKTVQTLLNIDRVVGAEAAHVSNAV